MLQTNSGDPNLVSDICYYLYKQSFPHGPFCPSGLKSRSLLIRMWFAIGCAPVYIRVPTRSCSPFFAPIFCHPFLFSPFFSLKTNVWLCALIYAKLPPSCLNPITFDQCDLPSHEYIAAACISLRSHHSCARFSNPLVFCCSFFSSLKLNGSMIYANPSPSPSLICNHVLLW